MARGIGGEGGARGGRDPNAGAKGGNRGGTGGAGERDYAGSLKGFAGFKGTGQTVNKKGDAGAFDPGGRFTKDVKGSQSKGGLTGYQQTQIKTGKATPKTSKQYEATMSNLAKVGSIAAGVAAGPLGSAIGGALAGPVGSAVGGMLGQTVGMGQTVSGAIDAVSDPAGALNPFEGYKGDVPGTSGMGTGNNAAPGSNALTANPAVPSPSPAPTPPAPTAPKPTKPTKPKPPKPTEPLTPNFELLSGAGGTLLGS